MRCAATDLGIAGILMGRGPSLIFRHLSLALHVHFMSFYPLDPLRPLELHGPVVNSIWSKHPYLGGFPKWFLSNGNPWTVRSSPSRRITILATNISLAAEPKVHIGTMPTASREDGCNLHVRCEVGFGLRRGSPLTSTYQTRSFCSLPLKIEKLFNQSTSKAQSPRGHNLPRSS